MVVELTGFVQKQTKFQLLKITEIKNLFNSKWICLTAKCILNNL